VQPAKGSRAHGSGGKIFSTKHATCQKAKQKISSANQYVMDLAGRKDIEKGVKKAAGRHADATNASKSVGQENKRGELIGLLVDWLIRKSCSRIALCAVFR
jgi:hypothetical protein